jgi:lipoprotein-anchoring transpeptidase ErfK/SrfK
MRHALTLLLALLLPAGAAAQGVAVHVDVSDQRMAVFRDEALLYEWPVSTARRGKVTPTGLFRPQVLVRFHRSRLYNNAPMPWSIFYDGNYAIHGTTDTARLGRPASAGCVRLHPDHAEVLWRLVREVGAAETVIQIVD